MGGNSSEEYQADSISPEGSVQNSSFLSSTTTSLSDDRNSADSMDKTDTPILRKKMESKEENETKEVDSKNEASKNPANIVRNLKIEVDESAMQQQIVDMYMRSMHQFTESLAKMKLPMDLDHKRVVGDDEQKTDHEKTDIDSKKKNNKDSSRVFYGSRAFF